MEKERRYVKILSETEMVREKYMEKRGYEES
jgi:hypothetical protein